eukprot:12240346-Alexandrium_andersonii.AAC.1
MSASLVGSEMCIRDRPPGSNGVMRLFLLAPRRTEAVNTILMPRLTFFVQCRSEALITFLTP